MKLSQKLDQFFSNHSDFFPSKSRIVIACSGGPDSVALARGLKQSKSHGKFIFVLGHVNHGLRGQESNKDQAFVKKLATTLGFRFMAQSAKVKATTSGNLEETARVKRYETLLKMSSKTKASAILTAHTKDDQVETVLMNLARGAGAEGLSGISPVRILSKKVLLARPMLGVSKLEVMRFLKQHKFNYRSDRSNKDQSFTRNWMRKTLIPLWESRAPGFKERVSDLTEILRDEQDHWDHVVGSVSLEVAKPHKGGFLVDWAKLLRYSPSVQRRLLRQFRGPDLLTFEGIERLRLWMGSPPSNGRQFQLRKGFVAERLSKSKGAQSATIYWFHRK